MLVQSMLFIDSILTDRPNHVSGRVLKAEIERLLHRDKLTKADNSGDTAPDELREDVRELIELYESIIHGDFHTITEEDIWERIEELKLKHRDE